MVCHPDSLLRVIKGHHKINVGKKYGFKFELSNQRNAIKSYWKAKYWVKVLRKINHSIYSVRKLYLS